VTGQAGRSAEGIPQKIPLGISQEFNLSTCMCFSFIYSCSYIFQFQKGMNTERSNSSSQFNSHLGPQIFGYHTKLFAQASWWLDHCQELVGWVQPPNQDPFYNPFAPIL